MLWFLVFGAIALGGLVMVVGFGVSLWRKSRALLDEVGGLLERADQLFALLDQVEVPGGPGAVRGDRPGEGGGARIDAAALDLSGRGAT